MAGFVRRFTRKLSDQDPADASLYIPTMIDDAQKEAFQQASPEARRTLLYLAGWTSRINYDIRTGIGPGYLPRHLAAKLQPIWYAPDKLAGWHTFRMACDRYLGQDTSPLNDSDFE